MCILIDEDEDQFKSTVKNTNSFWFIMSGGEVYVHLKSWIMVHAPPQNHTFVQTATFTSSEDGEFGISYLFNGVDWISLFALNRMLILT